MFTENAVAQQLLASGHALYFFSKRDRENSRNTMEIDFLITAGYDDSAGRMRVSPVEVKSTKRYGAKSIDKFKDKFGKRVGGFATSCIQSRCRSKATSCVCRCTWHICSSELGFSPLRLAACGTSGARAKTRS